MNAFARTLMSAFVRFTVRKQHQNHQVCLQKILHYDLFWPRRRSSRNSLFVRDRWSSERETEAASQNLALKKAWLVDQEWEEAGENVELETREAKRVEQIAGSQYDMRK